jgi:serine/threonine protein kinase
VLAASLYPISRHVRCIVVFSVKMAGMLRRQTKIKKRYTVDYTLRLGRGGFGEVYAGKDTTNGERVAVKLVVPDPAHPNSNTYIKRELEIMRNTSHPNLVRLLDDEIIGNTAYMVLELCTKNLNEFAKEEREGLPRPLKWQFIKEVILAFDYLHSIPIIHRDLKPNNILVKIQDEVKTVKVTDFGLSKIVEGKSSLTATAGIGTEGWMAPEIVTDPERPLRKLNYGIASDCFAVGLTVYAVVKHIPGEWLTTITGIG